jgi:general secretion pathway protein C
MDIDKDAGVAAGFESAEKQIRLDDLLSGNLFDLPPDAPDGGEEPDVDGEPDGGAPVVEAGPPEAIIPPCPIAAQVQVLVAGPAHHPELGFATIVHDGQAQEYRVGYDLGGNRLEQITWNRVYLAQGSAGGRLCFLDIRNPELAQAAGPAAPPQAKPPEQAPQPPADQGAGQSREDRFNQAINDSIEVTSDTDRNVQRSLINTILDNQDIAMRQARVMPHEENGEVIGFKVYGIRRDSLFGKLGLENGDLIQSINGIPMTGADKALQAYGRLRQADRISVTVTRRGQSITMNYNIR